MKHVIKTLTKTVSTKIIGLETINFKTINFASASMLARAGLFALGTLFLSSVPAQAQQSLTDFSVLPESLTGDVAANANILIILDNSGSMGRFSAFENSQIGAVQDGNYVRDGFTDTRYLRGRTAWDASSSLSNSFQVRQAILNVINDPQYTNRVNIGLMAFDTFDCNYDPADNNANNINVARDIDETNLLYECVDDANGNVIGAPVERREFNRSTSGLGLLRANVANLDSAHRIKLNRLLAIEPTPYVNDSGTRNIGVRTVNGNEIDTVIFGTPPTNPATGGPIVGAGSPASRNNPLHGMVHPFLSNNPADRVIDGTEFPILSSPDNAYSNFTPLSGSLDSAFRYLLRNDTAVDARTNLSQDFKDGLVNREISLVDSSIQYPTADQCEGDLIVILLTDGVASQIAPTDIVDGVGAGANGTTSTAAAVASARRLRLRGAASEADLDVDNGERPIELFVIGFNLNGSGLTSANQIANAGSSTVDADGNPIPARNAVDATSTEEVQNAFEAIFNDALTEGGSRSSLSVVAGADSALGSFIQPGFVPLRSEVINEGTVNEETISVSWTGDLANFFIDEFGNFREDTNGNGELDATDFGFLIEFDDGSELTHITRFLVDGDGNVVTGSLQGIANAGNTPTTPIAQAFDVFIEIPDLNPIWSANDQFNALATSEASISQNRNYNALPSVSGGRHILTSLDGTTTIPFVWSNANNAARIDPGEVGLFDLPIVDANDKIDATEDLINFIRGYEGNNDFRNRTLGNERFLLGDIVHSTPIQVEAPTMSGINSAAVAASFRPYAERYIDRRRMVYVGANDGMLHAFNGGFWDGLDEDDNNPGDLEVSTTPNSGTATGFALGQEIWAYVPRAVYPHLKFLSDQNYLADTHVSYVDGSTRSYEVKLFDNVPGNCAVGTADGVTAADSCRYVNGWGTILVVGLRLGGAPYTGDLDNNPSTPDETTAASYMIFDVTNPELPPVLIAEISNPAFNLGTVAPTVVRTSVQPGGSSPEIDYAIVFGSGPTDLQTATSTDNSGAELFVYSLEGRSAVQSGSTINVQGSPTNTFVGGISAADWNGDDVDDAVYFGTIGGTVDTPTGQLYRGEIDNSFDTQMLVDALSAIEETPTIPENQLSTENKYILFGTGRNLVPDDLQQDFTRENLFAGIIEDITAMDSDSVTFGNGTIAASLNSGNILDTTGADTTGSSAVDGVLNNPPTNPGGGLDSTRSDLLIEFGNDSGDTYQGWVFELPLGTSRTSAAPFTLEELAFFSEFEPQLLDPNSTECLASGTGFVTVFDYRIGVVPASERFLLSEDVLLPIEQRAAVSSIARVAVSSSLLAGGAALLLAEDSDGNIGLRIKLPGGDQDVTELAGTLLAFENEFGRSAWREIPIPE